MNDPKIKTKDDNNEEVHSPSILDELQELLDDKEDYRP